MYVIIRVTTVALHYSTNFAYGAIQIVLLLL